MTIREALQLGETKLRDMETPNLDAVVLLSFVVKKPKIFLYTYGEKNLTAKQRSAFLKLIKRRAKYEPVAYLINKKEFYGRDFAVNKNVLIPRPETELIIDIAKTTPANTIIDVGTGSGIIAVTLAKELQRPIVAIDISVRALAVAKQNAKKYHANIKFFRGNLLDPILKLTSYKSQWQSHRGSSTKSGLQPTGYLIVANLPYLPTARKKMLTPDIKKYEPTLALFGGSDGLKYYRQLLAQIKNLSVKQWILIAEIDSLQKKSFAQMAKKILPKAELTFKKDLDGHVRAAIIKASKQML